MTYELIQFGLFKGLLALYAKWGEEPLDQLQKKVKNWDNEPNKKFILLDIRGNEGEPRNRVVDPLEVIKTTALLRDLGYFVILWMEASQNHALYKTVQHVEVWLLPDEQWIELRPNALILDPIQGALNRFEIPQHLSDLPVFIAWRDYNADEASIAAIAESLPVPCRIQKPVRFIKVGLNDPPK